MGHSIKGTVNPVAGSVMNSILQFNRDLTPKLRLKRGKVDVSRSTAPTPTEVEAVRCRTQSLD